MGHLILKSNGTRWIDIDHSFILFFKKSPFYSFILTIFDLLIRDCFKLYIKSILLPGFKSSNVFTFLLVTWKMNKNYKGLASVGRIESDKNCQRAALFVQFAHWKSCPTWHRHLHVFGNQWGRQGDLEWHIDCRTWESMWKIIRKSFITKNMCWI